MRTSGPGARSSRHLAREARRPRCSVPGVEPERARQLLERERQRIEGLIEELRHAEADEQDEPGDLGSENLYQKEFDEGRAAGLREQLAAVERAEDRLAAGTYGISVVSGEPIPDERLEAIPAAERNVGE